MTLTHLVPLAAVSLLLLAGCQSTTGAVDRWSLMPLPPTRATPPPMAQVKAVYVAPAQEVATEMVEFVARVEAYDALRERLLAEAPASAAKATPEELDTHQRALADRIVAARSEAQPGDIFVPDMQAAVLTILPTLPRDCEYRFVGESLILLDTRAHLVVDVMSLAVPKT